LQSQHFSSATGVALKLTRRVRIRDVAEACGASITTVSLVLNKTSLAQRLSPETRRRVEEAALRLGYTADPVARSLRTRQSSTVGIMVFDLADPYCTRLLKGIEAALIRTDYLPLVMSMQNEVELLSRYWKLMNERRVEGILVIANWPSVNLSVFETFRSRTCVMIGATPPDGSGISYITVDSMDGGAKAMAHLQELGHKQIAVLRGPAGIEESEKRWQGILHCARLAGIELDLRLCPQLSQIPHFNSIFEEADRLVTELMANELPFTAMLTFDDLSAVGALRAFDRHGVRVPDDCSLVGFDDIPYAQLVRPPLTTMHQPLEEMGAIAVEYLLAQMSRKPGDPPLEALARTVKADLVVRESTRACKGKP
jgi:DNA-binding LacI/PurR family transcriptional regulator